MAPDAFDGNDAAAAAITLSMTNENRQMK